MAKAWKALRLRLDGFDYEIVNIFKNSTQIFCVEFLCKQREKWSDHTLFDE